MMANPWSLWSLTGMGSPDSTTPKDQPSPHPRWHPQDESPWAGDAITCQPYGHEGPVCGLKPSGIYHEHELEAEVYSSSK